MNSTLELAVQELETTLDQCFAAWAESAQSGDPAPVMAYAADVYNGTAAHPGADQAEFFTRDEAMAGIPRLITYIKGCRQVIDGRHIRMRSAEEGVVSFDQAFERDGQVLIRFLYLQTWRKIEGRWLLVREALEQLTS